MFAIATAVPIAVTVWGLHAFAGKTTDLKINVVASISLLANLTMGGAIWRKNRAMAAQRAELERTRGRAEALEARTTTVAPSPGRQAKDS